MHKRPVMLIILDGWGLREMTVGNAVLQAQTPNYDRWMSSLERSVIDASEEAVGLIPGQMGNSEVGHLNLGAGRVVYQDITKIDKAIRENTLRDTEGLRQTINNVKQNKGKLHLIGLVSDGGVHSHIDHLTALLDITHEEQIETVVHVITDGRDTPTNSGIEFVRDLQSYMDKIGHGQIATLSGRYYAMDRDKRWDRTQKAYEAMVSRTGNRAPDAVAAVQQSYDQEVTDEFIVPTVIEGDNLAVEDGDGLIFFNFRADRMRQIVQAFANDSFDGFERKPLDIEIVTFTRYEDDLPVIVLFDKDNLSNTLAEVISQKGLTQYHSAETEKYPHVTYFFNGRNEDPFPGETRKIIPSPKVATYDLKPEMSAIELTETTLKRLQTHDDDFILINFANPDMVGHTGSLEAAVRAVECVDECAARLVDAVQEKGGVAIVTADHGNCERMIELTTGEAHTYHTTNPVALFVIGEGYYLLRPRGKLADVAPTVLDLMGIEKPPEMTGVSLVETYTTQQKITSDAATTS